VGRQLTATQVEDMHLRKTGALIEASVALPAALAGAATADVERLGRFARDLGLAFQIVDDILDVEGDPRLLGKAVGAIASFGESAAMLVWLAGYIVERSS